MIQETVQVLVPVNLVDVMRARGSETKRYVRELLMSFGRGANYCGGGSEGARDEVLMG